MAPPIYVKGGAWTNVEDEILKAAISKYGLTQWARVSSLLPKKSSKQVKARWFEYLFPLMQGGTASWTKQEDSKLLQLIKVFPNQWRSIAPLLNKTPTQCIERYQKLLDEVLGGDVTTSSEQLDDLGLSGPGVETLPASGPSLDDLHINPETMPSIPQNFGEGDDNMDDDREMLSEAKARLANTSGKKAKRKARERMLDESKRIALLQKRRGMKEAGFKVSLETSAMKRKRNKEFDYVNDIVHEHTPQAGLYDTSAEIVSNTRDKARLDRTVAKEGLNIKDLENRNKKKSNNNQKRTSEVADKSTTLLSSLPKKRKLELSQPEQDHEMEDIDEKIAREVRQSIISNSTNSTLSLDDKTDSSTLVEPEKLTSKGTVGRTPLLKMLKERFLELPKPKNGSSQVILPIGEDVIAITRGGSNEVDLGERLRNLEILRKVSEEQEKLRRSQVVQRGLTIPNPSKLIALENLPPIEALIQKELHSLVKSDFSKYQDSTYPAAQIEDLDEELWEKVQKEVEQELAKDGNPKTIRSDSVDLPHDPETIERVINKLHEYHSQAQTKEAKLLSLISTTAFSAKEAKLMNEIHESFNESIVLNQDIGLAEKVSLTDDAAYSNRLARLRNMVDEVDMYGQELKVRIQESQAL